MNHRTTNELNRTLAGTIGNGSPRTARWPGGPRKDSPDDTRRSARFSPRTSTGHHMLPCVFHVDRHSSLSVDPTKLVFYCFGCRAAVRPTSSSCRASATAARRSRTAEPWRRLKATYL
jgi:CHC2 zinc finger